METSISHLNAIILGILQGLTEFLPISSTAHLYLWGAFTGEGDPGAAYSAVIQLGSLFALLFYFRKDLYSIIRDAYQDFQKFPRPKDLKQKNVKLRFLFESLSPGSKLLVYLAIGTSSICVAGLSFSHWIHGPLRSSDIISSSLILVALWMCFAEYYGKQKITLESLAWQHALWIGLAQCLALIPGASRSGTTLAMALCLGLSRPAALRFSFLLSIPAIGLSGFYELFTQIHDLKNIGFLPLGISTLLAIFSSYLCIAFILHYVRNHKIVVFAIYRIFLGIFVLLYF